MAKLLTCIRCGKNFKESELITIPYQEYPGTKVWEEEASPCCRWHFNDPIDLLEAEEYERHGIRMINTGK
jgi:hypothetical protein